jgi:hypothetical protein
VVLRSVQEAKAPGRRQPAPIGLSGLVVLAEAIGVDLQREEDGATRAP